MKAVDLNTLSRRVAEFLARDSIEGVRLKAYQDGAGIWTIGIGSTTITTQEGGTKRRAVCSKDILSSKEEAIVLCMDHLKTEVIPHIMKLMGSSKEGTEEGLLIALCSLVYNVGSSITRKEEVIRCIKEGNLGKVSVSRSDSKFFKLEDPNTISGMFMKYIKVRDPKTKELKPCLGLIRRRLEEVKLFTTVEETK
jgi:lysozyme